MNAHRNYYMNNRPRKQGNTAYYFQRLKSLVAKNDGTRSFILRTVDCHDQSAPFNENQETRIQITHDDHMISQITDGFLTFRVRLNLQLTGVDQSFNDTNNLCKLFVGFKSSNQIMDQLQILCRNLNTGYQQNECCREGFAYSTIKPYTEKKTRKYTHSLYENITNYSTSVCGTYININDFKDGKPHEVEFEVNLPFDDLLPLQAFDLFPNFCCGNIELKFYVKSRGLVWCMLNPDKVKDYKEIIQGEKTNIDLSDVNLAALFKHAFTQINNSADIITKWSESTEQISGVDITKASAESGSALLQCVGMTIQQLKSNMYGFGISAKSAQAIMEVFRTPQVIPAQQLDYNAFPLAATRAGIQTTINMPITNTTCITIMFPKHDNDYTVFENPIYDNVQLTVNGKNVPDEPVSTQGARFLQYQLVASDLSGGLQCTQEFEDSMIMAKNDAQGIRYKNSLTDGTSFMLNLQTERNNAGYTYDGYDSGGQNIAIQLKGQPIFTDENDTYWNFNNDGGKTNPPPPQIWCCRDTYFLASVNGLQYYNMDSPPGSQDK